MNPIKAKAAHPVLARFSPIAFDSLASAPTEIMWMPGGIHEITAHQADEAVTVTVKVDRATAATMQQELAALKAESPQRPYFDFDHDGGRAAAWPIEFLWKDSPKPGVYARVEWSAAGRNSVEGREYRAFSPSFYTDSKSPATVIGAPLDMGGLVNDPAFKQMLPLFAKSKETHMNKQQKLKLILAALAAAHTAHAALLAKSGADAAKPEEIQASNAGIQSKLAEAQKLQGEIEHEAETSSEIQAKLAAKESALAVVQARADALEAKAKERAQADAKAAVDAAVARGAIAAQDAAAQTRWMSLIVADAGNAALLAGIPGSVALGAPIVGGSFHGSEVGQEDIRRVVRAMSAEARPAARGAIWANDLSKRDRRALIQAANSLGTLTGEFIVQESLDLLTLDFPLLAKISSRFTDQNIAFGQTIKTRLRTIPAVTDYSTTTGYASSDATATDVAVVMNAHKAIQIEFNANEMASTSRDLFGENNEGMQYALGKTLIDALYLLITGVNYTNSTTKALASFARADVTAMAKALAARSIPMNGRMLALNPDYFEKLQNDPTIVQLATYQKPEVITDYTLPPIAGFEIFQAVNLPTAANLTGFAFRPDSWAIASGLPNDYASALPGVTGGGITSVVTNEKSGLSVTLTQFIDHKLGKAIARVAVVFGVAVGQPASGQILKSA